MVALGALGVHILTGDDGSGPAADQAHPGTILLVPGYGGSQTALSRLAEVLRAAGRTATLVDLPGDGTGDLLMQAKTLQAAVDLALRGGAPSVDVVGYSAGGVVTRLWVDRAGARTVRRVVTLGSPLHGTRVAGLGAALAPDACPTACRQLAPGSDLLHHLDDATLPKALPWLSIWTENDETVQPPDSARLAGAVNVSLQGICPQAQVAHGELPTDPLVTALVVQALDSPTLTAPTRCPR